MNPELDKLRVRDDQAAVLLPRMVAVLDLQSVQNQARCQD
jgi:hypothetical protein